MTRIFLWLAGGSLAIVLGAGLYLSRPVSPLTPLPPVAPAPSLHPPPVPVADAEPLQSVPALPPLAKAPPSPAKLAAAAPAGLSVAEAQRLKALSGAREGEVPGLSDALEPLRRWASANPEEAARWVLENLLGTARDRALEEVFGAWAAKSPTEALAWLDRQKVVEGLRGAHSVVLGALVHDDPAAAAQWLLAAGHRAPPDGWSILFSGWGGQDPEIAARWALANLSANRLSVLLPELLATLPSPEAADLLLAHFPAGAADEALAEAARRVARSNPAFAATLAGQIGADAGRSEVQSEVLAIWKRRDPAGAASYAAQQHITLPAAGSSTLSTAPASVAPAIAGPAESGTLPPARVQ